jgi:hypothetical protein
VSRASPPTGLDAHVAGKDRFRKFMPPLDGATFVYQKVPYCGAPVVPSSELGSGSAMKVSRLV